MTPNEIKAALNQFCGTDNWYRHPLFRRFLYTDGVKFLADSCGAYWFIDNIFSYQLLNNVKTEEFQVWTMRVAGSEAVVTCEDGNDNQVFTANIEFTDFPLEEITLWLENDVLMLPGER